MTTQELIDAAVERGHEFERNGYGKANSEDFTRHVLDIVGESKRNWEIPNSMIANAIAHFWED